MFGYYLDLALRGLVRNPGLTLLMVASIGVGIGASMTTFAVFRAMDGDPIAYKAAELYVPQIQNLDPDVHTPNSSVHADGLSDALSYIDALALMRAHAAPRQTALYETRFAVTPSDPQLLPFQVGARAGYADLFAMFDVPFAYGGPWSAADDQAHAPVAVISRALNDKVFGGSDSVGKVLRLDGQDYRVVGVLRDWNPVPRYYDLQDAFGLEPDDVFVPFTRAIEQHKFTGESSNCSGPQRAPGWSGLLQSECVWLQFWVQLPSAADAARYRAFLRHYAADQQRSGRFHWTARTRLRDLRQWLSYEHVVSNEVRMLVVVGFGFLVVCLVNAMGLMLARVLFRSADTGVRRALGADRGAVFAQGLIEAAVIGAAGALLGVSLTALGLAGLRALLSREALVLARMDLPEVGMAMLLAIAAAIAAGLYPTWRATRVQPAWQLRAR